ncbi:hypothetical protein AB0K51_26095 [Kitasatospora sp. NPDC049285]|uniref:hypothetical protein n=1 Tax=Kitasatospora sp. NPDC049285 TaxID=3157096 RepID=UPI00344A4BB8
MTAKAGLLAVLALHVCSLLGWFAAKTVSVRRERTRARMAAADLAVCEHLWALPEREHDRD